MRLNLGILRYGWLMVGSLFVACDDTTGPSGLRVSTSDDRLELHPQGMAEVSFSITNRGGTSVFLLSRCGDRIIPVIDRKESGSWAQYIGAFCQAIYDMSPLELGPGESLHSVSFIHDAGTYRLRIEAGSGPNATTQWTTVSNSFTVK